MSNYDIAIRLRIGVTSNKRVHTRCKIRSEQHVISAAKY